MCPSRADRESDVGERAGRWSIVLIMCANARGRQSKPHADRIFQQTRKEFHQCSFLEEKSYFSMGWERMSVDRTGEHHSEGQTANGTRNRRGCEVSFAAALFTRFHRVVGQEGMRGSDRERWIATSRYPISLAHTSGALDVKRSQKMNGAKSFAQLCYFSENGTGTGTGTEGKPSVRHGVFPNRTSRRDSRRHLARRCRASGAGCRTRPRDNR